MKTILGKKMGMTQIFTEHGAVVPVTVVEAGPMTVTQIKTVETDGYDAVQFGFEDAKPQRVNKPMTGHFERTISLRKSIWQSSDLKRVKLMKSDSRSRLQTSK